MEFYLEDPLLQMKIFRKKVPIKYNFDLKNKKRYTILCRRPGQVYFIL